MKPTLLLGALVLLVVSLGFAPEALAQAPLETIPSTLSSGGVKIELTPSTEAQGNLAPALKLGLMLLLLGLLPAILVSITSFTA